MILRTYGGWMAGHYAAGGPQRYRVQAWGLITLRLEGMHTWVWSATTGRYVAAGDPWVIWDADSEAAARKAADP